MLVADQMRLYFGIMSGSTVNYSTSNLWNLDCQFPYYPRLGSNHSKHRTIKELRNLKGHGRHARLRLNGLDNPA